MTESKITASHRRRTAVIYVRQSSVTQVDRNKESTARQYDLVARAHALGWPSSAVSVIDDDLGVSGASTAGRSGFAELAAQVGLGQVGIVLALEVSRLARNNADWYRLLDLAGMTDTLIADADGVYHPGLFNDRLLLGMKGTMSGGRTAHPAGPPGRRPPQQGRARRTAHRVADRAGLERRRRTDPQTPQRGRPRRYRRHLRTVRRPWFGAGSVVVAA